MAAKNPHGRNFPSVDVSSALTNSSLGKVAKTGTDAVAAVAFFIPEVGPAVSVGVKAAQVAGGAVLHLFKSE